MPQPQTVTASAFRADNGRKIVIDLREEEDFLQGSIPGAVNFPLTGPADGASFDRDALVSFVRETAPSAEENRTPVVCFCRFGILSRDAAQALADAGFHAIHLEGGYGVWALEDIRQAALDEEKRRSVEQSLTRQFHTPIFSKFARAIVQYDLLSPGDKVAVCISGGKDSMLMAKLFQQLKRHDKFPFELVFLCMDPGYSAENRKIIESNAALLGIPITFVTSNIFDAVEHVEKSPCYLCARMRRGYLYRYAKELGCNKIALGHHFDDVIETVLMGMLYAGQFQAMMPKLRSTNFPGMELIRPMYFVREADILRFRDENGLHFIRCACHFTDTCSTVRGDGDSRSKRIETKRLIAELKKTNPQVEKNLLRATENVVLNKVLGYKLHGEAHSFLEDY